MSSQGVLTQASIQVRGARVHNLKNIEFEIPHNVIIGVSGSGKSSLAYHTIYGPTGPHTTSEED